MAVRTTVLENGLTVVSDDYPGLATVSAGVFVEAGARHESESQNGLSHLLEHMAFKGTARRSARRIAEEIEEVGGHLNAYTAREQTTYYAKVLKDDLPLAVDLLADILQHSAFDEAEFAKEQDVILQEIGQAIDTPDDIIFDYLQEAAFPGQSVGRSILGTAEKVQAYTTGDLKAYFERHYCASSMVFAAAGALDHDRLVDQVAGAFTALPACGETLIEPGAYKGGEWRDERELEQVHVTLGLSGFAFSDPDYYALQVFSTLFGGGMSSRLFQEVREDRGLAYSVYSFAASHTDSGLFGIYAGTDPEDAEALIPVIAETLARSATDISEAELARARAQLKAGLLMALESTSARIEQLGRQMHLFGRVVPVEELSERVSAVDAAAVARVVERLRASPLTIASVGPVSGIGSRADLTQLFQA